MRVTTSLLADAATVADGKLYIHGAGWDRINSPVLPVTHPGMALVLVLEVDPVVEDRQDVEIRLVDESDTPIMGVTGHVGISDPSKVVPGTLTNLPLAVNFAPVPFPHAGTYRFVLLVNGTEIHSAKLSVVADSE
jgi:hypothetical protein